MTKNEFLKRLSRALRQMKREEREKSLAFYREMLDDRVEAGLTEETAVAEMEDISVIAAGILQDAATRCALKKERNPIVIILLIIGSPLWASLLIVLFACMAVVTACLWIAVACLYAVVAALACGSVGCIFGFAVFLWYPAAAAFCFGAALVSAGLGVFLCLFANLTARGFARATGWMWRGVCRKLFSRRKTV